MVFHQTTVKMNTVGKNIFSLEIHIILTKHRLPLGMYMQHAQNFLLRDCVVPRRGGEMGKRRKEHKQDKKMNSGSCLSFVLASGLGITLIVFLIHSHFMGNIL